MWLQKVAYSVTGWVQEMGKRITVCAHGFMGWRSRQEVYPGIHMRYILLGQGRGVPDTGSVVVDQEEKI